MPVLFPSAVSFAQQQEEGGSGGRSVAKQTTLLLGSPKKNYFFPFPRIRFPHKVNTKSVAFRGVSYPKILIANLLFSRGQIFGKVWQSWLNAEIKITFFTYSSRNILASLSKGFLQSKVALKWCTFFSKFRSPKHFFYFETDTETQFGEGVLLHLYGESAGEGGGGTKNKPGGIKSNLAALEEAIIIGLLVCFWYQITKKAFF